MVLILNPFSTTIVINSNFRANPSMLVNAVVKLEETLSVLGPREAPAEAPAEG